MLNQRTAMFRTLAKKGTVLDLGCGAGADALFFASNGHPVTAVDRCEKSIAHLNNTATRLGLAVWGITNDLVWFTPDSQYELVLLNTALRSYGLPKQRQIILRALDWLVPGGQLWIADRVGGELGMIQSELSLRPMGWTLHAPSHITILVVQRTTAP